MFKNLFSVLMVCLLSFGIIGCNKTNDSKNESNKNNKVVANENENIDGKDLSLVLNFKLTDFLQDNFKSEQNINRVILSEKSKKEDEAQKDKYIIFSIDEDKINNINSEDLANKAIGLIAKKENTNFWKNHNGKIYFTNPNDNSIIYSKYITKQGSNKLMKVANE